MAGSFRHCEDEEGLFTFNKIDNMGDAYEACEEMFFMVKFLSKDDPKKIKEAFDAFIKFQQSK